jgi:hypothetical protein
MVFYKKGAFTNESSLSKQQVWNLMLQKERFPSLVEMHRQ